MSYLHEVIREVLSEHYPNHTESNEKRNYFAVTCRCGSRMVGTLQTKLMDYHLASELEAVLERYATLEKIEAP